MAISGGRGGQQELDLKQTKDKFSSQTKIIFNLFNENTIQYIGDRLQPSPSVMQPMQVTSPDAKCRVQKTERKVCPMLMKLNGMQLEIVMANRCMTINDLSQKSNVSRVALTRFISGKCNPKPATIGKIAKALGVTVQELIETEAATSNQLNRDSENNQN